MIKPESLAEARGLTCFRGALEFWGPTGFIQQGSPRAELSEIHGGLVWDAANLMRYMKNPRQTTGVNVQVRGAGSSSDTCKQATPKPPTLNPKP